jgi:hypothetical protein
VEARSQTAQIEESRRPSRRRNLEEVYEEEINEGSFTLGLPHWYYYSNSEVLINSLDAPRPAVAPFSSSDHNGMVDDNLKPLQDGCTPENLDEEDEVMMDFVSER